MDDAEVKSWDYVLCWFIGGPWNNRLCRIARSVVEAEEPMFQVPEIRKGVGGSWNGVPIDSWEARTLVDYWLTAPLETGVPVFTCLDRSYCCRFGLRSVTGSAGSK